MPRVPIVAAFIKKHQLVPSHTELDDSVSLQLELNGDKMESQEHSQQKETTVGNRARMGHTHTYTCHTPHTRAVLPSLSPGEGFMPGLSPVAHLHHTWGP